MTLNSTNIIDDSDKILDLIIKVKNYEDIGSCARWALDNFELNIKAWLVAGQIYTTIDTVGKWSTIKGARTPQNNANCSELQEGNAKGKMIQSINGSFPVGTKILLNKCERFGFYRTFDLGGTYADLLLPPDEQKGTLGLTYILSFIFSQPLTLFTLTAEYFFCNKLLWVDSTGGFLGNVKIGPNGCPIE